MPRSAISLSLPDTTELSTSVNLADSGTFPVLDEAHGYPGDRIGRWELISMLGRGGFGTTWRAVDADGNTAAVKLLGAAPGVELRALRKVCHPRVARYLDSGAVPRPFVAMELVPGVPLDRALSGGAMSEEDAAALAAALFDGLAALHRAGHSHGDIKPANILLDPNDPSTATLIDLSLSDTTHGGTFAYAPPEQLVGGSGGPAGDIYSTGLVVFEALHGHAPWPELALSEAVVRRVSDVPVPTEGPRWLRELVSDLLSPEPSHRPPAALVADRLASRGRGIEAPSLELLARRALTASVERPETEYEVASWQAAGGTLAIVGPQGSGKSHLLEELLSEVVAEGGRAVRVGGPPRTWARSPDGRNPGWLGAVRDVETRTELFAAEVLGEGAAPVIFVDDVAAVDPASLAVLELIAKRKDAAILVTGVQPPIWADLCAVLEPLDRAQVARLVDGVLGYGSQLGSLYDRALQATHGLPAAVVGFVLAAVGADAVTWRGSRWVGDAAALRALDPPPLGRWPVLLSCSAEARTVGGYCSLHPPGLARECLASLAVLSLEATDRAVEQLIASGLAEQRGDMVRCAGRGAAEALTPRGGGLDEHRQLLSFVLGHEPARPARVAWHLAAVADPELTLQWGAPAVKAITLIDAERAAELAESLWPIAPHPELALARLHALARAGRIEEASAFADGLLDDAGLEEERGRVCLALARMHVDATDDPEEARRLLEVAAEAFGGDEPPLAVTILRLQLDAKAGGLAANRADIERMATCEPPDDPDLLDRWLELRVSWAEGLQRDGEPRRALAVLGELPMSLGAGRPARARLEAARSRFLWILGRIDEAAAVLATVLESQWGLSPLTRTRLLNNLGAIQYRSGARSAAVRSWEEAALAFERSQARVELTRVRVNLCQGYRDLGLRERAKAVGLRAVDDAAFLEVPELEAMAMGNLMDVAIEERDWVVARALYRAAHAQAMEHGIAPELVELGRRRAEMAVLQGDPSAVEVAREARDAARTAEDAVEAALCESILALALARAGHSGVHRAIEAALGPLADAGAAGVLAEARLWAAEALLEVDDLEGAVREADAAGTYAEEVEHLRLRVRADGVLARVGDHSQDPQTGARLTQVLAAAAAIAREGELDAILRRLAEVALSLLEGDRAFVVLADSMTVAASATQAAGPAGEPSWSIVRRALLGRREVIAAELGERGDLRDHSSVMTLLLRSAICVPMIVDDDVLGVIYLDSQTTAKLTGSAAAELMRALAALAGVSVCRARDQQSRMVQAARDAAQEERRRNEAALADAASELSRKNAVLEQLNRNLSRAALVDPLSDVGNRRSFQQFIRQLHRESIALGRTYGLALIDIDHFKQCNDRHGHGFGDDVIRGVAQTLSDALRSADRVFRLGGDEFAVVLSDASGQSLSRVLERLRAGVAQRRFTTQSLEPMSVTVSVGGARFDGQEPVAWEELLRIADAALYVAKAAGRDCVRVRSLSGEIG